MTWWGSLVRVQSRLPNKIRSAGRSERGSPRGEPLFCFARFHVVAKPIHSLGALFVILDVAADHEGCLSVQLGLWKKRLGVRQNTCQSSIGGSVLSLAARRSSSACAFREAFPCCARLGVCGLSCGLIHSFLRRWLSATLCAALAAMELGLPILPLTLAFKDSAACRSRCCERPSLGASVAGQVEDFLRALWSFQGCARRFLGGES